MGGSFLETEAASPSHRGETLSAPGPAPLPTSALKNKVG